MQRSHPTFAGDVPGHRETFVSEPDRRFKREVLQRDALGIGKAFGGKGVRHQVAVDVRLGGVLAQLFLDEPFVGAEPGSVPEGMDRNDVAVVVAAGAKLRMAGRPDAAGFEKRLSVVLRVFPRQFAERDADVAGNAFLAWGGGVNEGVNV